MFSIDTVLTDCPLPTAPVVSGVGRARVFSVGSGQMQFIGSSEDGNDKTMKKDNRTTNENENAKKNAKPHED